MASTQIAQGVRFMSSDMRNKLGSYMTSLEMRYGDPRVYALQQAEMNRVDANLAHDLSRRQSDWQQGQYYRQREEQRTAHRKRIRRIRTRGPPSSATPRESAADQPRTQPPAAHVVPSAFSR